MALHNTHHFLCKNVKAAINFFLSYELNWKQSANDENEILKFGYDVISPKKENWVEPLSFISPHWLSEIYLKILLLWLFGD